MENHIQRPEIREARRTGTGSATRYSQTLGTDVMYAAAAIRNPDTAGDRPAILGYVRVALPLTEVEAAVNQMSRTLLISGSVMALAAAALAVYVSSRITRPIHQLTSAAERIASGDLSGRLLPTTRDEVGQLTRAFNYMADQVHEQVATLALERTRLSTVLETMGDGVIITDASGDIVMANAAAARILRYELDKMGGDALRRSRTVTALWTYGGNVTQPASRRMRPLRRSCMGSFYRRSLRHSSPPPHPASW
jgi:two-component system, OmpR family, phosphate regulon sensor histidine kinase PhoR